MVRKKVNGQWQVTKAGDEYYRGNKNEYVVHVPCRRVASTIHDGFTTHHWAKGSYAGETFPVADLKHMRANDHGGPIPAAFDEPLVLPKITVQVRLAEENARQAYLKEGVLSSIHEHAAVVCRRCGRASACNRV